MTAEREPNREQWEVIRELDRNIILYASAGTGKTFTLARRVSNIIQQKRAKPAEILCMTFTVKAAREIRDDILRVVGSGGASVAVSTIHSFAFSVLKEESIYNTGVRSFPDVCDDVDETSQIRELLSDRGLPCHSPIMKNDTALYSFVSTLKSQRELMNVYSECEEADYQRVYNSIRNENDALYHKMIQFYDFASNTNISDARFLNLMSTRAGDLVASYNKYLRRNNLLDYDDLILLTHRLFKQEGAARKWEDRYKYVIIDEMQDTSELEYDTVSRIFGDNNIMMCGDFFQTIYEWRGSNPERVLGRFTGDFRPAVHMFSRNYRSTRTLTAASFGYLKNTYPEEVGKYCPSDIEIESSAAGERISVVRSRDISAEAEWIFNYFSAHRPADPASVCIMSRRRAYIADLDAELEKINETRPEGERLRFFTVDKDLNFFRKAAIKDILAFYRLMVYQSDAAAFKRIAAKYIRDVGTQTVKKTEEIGELGLDLASFADPLTYERGDPYAPLMEAFEQENVVVYDTETTGLDLSRDQIVQLSAIRLDRNGNKKDGIDLFVMPTVDITPGAQATHHLSMEDLKAKGAVPVEKALEIFGDFARGAVLVGHNSLRFDAPLVWRQLYECGMPGPDVIAQYDTMVMAKQFYPKQKNYKLDTLCALFGVVNEAAHDAMGDITATGRVLTEMLRRKVIPQAECRRAAVQKFAPKYEKFYTFLQQIRNAQFRRGDIAGMTRAIMDRCCMEERYSEPGSRNAMADLLYMTEHAEIGDPFVFLRDLLTDAALSGTQMDLLIRKMNKIPIITVHQSKGCEFDTVIVAGCDDGEFPLFRAVMEDMLDEEQRVFYVAISRAKKKLILTSTELKKTRYGTFRKNEPSRFIEMIPESCVAI